MIKALGFVEVSGVTGAVDCLDIMCKAADVEFVTWERRMGGRLVTVVVTGVVSAVTAAVESAIAHSVVTPVAHDVIPNPHEETIRILELSARKFVKPAPAKVDEEELPELQSHLDSPDAVEKPMTASAEPEAQAPAAKSKTRTTRRKTK